MMGPAKPDPPRNRPGPGSRVPAAWSDHQVLVDRSNERPLCSGAHEADPMDPNEPAIRSKSLPRLWLEGGMAMLSSAGAIDHINTPLAEWLGKRPAELAGEPLWDLLAARHPSWRTLLNDLRSSPAPFVTCLLHAPGRDEEQGDWFNLEVARARDTHFLRLCSVLPPQAELEEGSCDQHLRSEGSRRAMFLRLMRTESQLHTLTQRWPGVIFSQRADLSLRFSSPRIEEFTGASLELWQRRPEMFWEVVHEADAEGLRLQLKAAAHSPEGVTSTFRIRHLHTGRITYVLENRQAMTSPGGLLLGYECLWLDVTRQAIAERRLSTAAWKETLAVLTMGLVHDFSNVMSGIHSLSESFVTQIDETHPFHEGLSLIQKNSLQASKLVHRIIHLHQGKTGESNYHDLNEVLTELKELVRKIVPRRIEFVVEPSPEGLPLYIDLVEFRQVIINLIINAVDAMPQTGRLTLTASRHTELPPLAFSQGSPPRLPAICLSVQDTGCGIKERHLQNIFDAFFTTKPVDKGSGLGLYNARLFVERCHGCVSVESQEGVGTIFRLWLPEADFTETLAAANAAPARRHSLLVLGQPGETLENTAEFLRTNGFHVVTAISAANANACLHATDYEFSLIMILAEPADHDLLNFIPGARRAHPRLKFILKLVGRDEEEVESTILNRVDRVVAADVSSAALLERLRQSL